MSTLGQVLVFLAATVVAVPLFKRLGLGSVLGYLTAGVVVGPGILGVFTDVEGTLHFAEFGVVLLLFIIGLELQPSRLWAMRRAVFGVGGVQVALTAVVLTGACLAFGLAPATAAIVGVGLSLSSTAFALQLLAEKNQLTTQHGRAAFGILLFQDVAVIPVLALLPLIGHAATPSTESGWVSALKMATALSIVVLAGRYLMKPLFKVVARAHTQDVFTASALLVAVGTAALVSVAGLSMALGAFLAGVLLAESEYRHELEADIEPFKGLLLGLFFMAVGMSVKIALVAERPLTIAALVVGLVAVKALLLFGIGRFIFRSTAPALNMSLVISQGGEFAFVLFSLAVGYQIMDRALADLLVVVVSLSMVTTPPLLLVYERLIAPRFKKRDDRTFDVKGDEDTQVIIAGFGRVGQVTGRILRAKGIPFTAMDANPDHIDFVRKFGNKVFFGDASRLDLLRAARVDRAKVFLLAIDDVEASLRTAKTVMEHFPNVTIYARARNRQHAYRLLDMGVTNIMRETFLSSLEMAGDVLRTLGVPFSETRRMLDRFREYDEKLLLQNYKLHNDEKALQELAAKSRQELEEIFASDAVLTRRKSA